MTAARDLLALTAFLDGRISMPFDWGRTANDCISFAAGAVEAQGGDAQLGDLDWTDEASATAAIESQGGLEAALDARFARVAPAMAMRGDIAALEDEIGPFGIRIMIVEGLTLVGPGERRATRERRSKMIAAWSAMPLPDGGGE